MILGKIIKKNLKNSCQLLAFSPHILLVVVLSLTFATSVYAQGSILGTAKQYQQNFSFNKGKFKGAIVVVGQPSDSGTIQTNLSRVVADAQLFYDLLNSENPSSEVAALNTNPNKTNVEVSQSVANAFRAAKQAAKLTKGVFDFVVSNGNYNSVSISKNDPTIKFKDPGIQINFGPIMKGIMADYIITSLQTVNLGNAIVRIGNVFKAVGESKRGPWIVQVQADSGTKARRALNFKLSDTGIATESTSDSRSYPLTNFRTKNTVSPMCRGVTITMKEAAAAQGVAYAAMTVGPEEGMKILNRGDQAYGFIVDLNGNFLKTPGL